MKQILILAFFPIFLRAQTQQPIANFSGHWVAQSGALSSTIGIKAQCSNVDIVIEQTDTQILTKSYKSDCGLWGVHWGPIPQEIRNGKIYEKGVEVGTITSDTLITVSTDGSYKYAYNLRLKKAADGHVVMDSYYGTQGAAGAIVTEATHEKVP
jgi:hypothetical protein